VSEASTTTGATSSGPLPRRALVRARAWWRLLRLSRALPMILVVAAVASGVATVATWTGARDTAPDADTVLALLILDAILLLTLGALVGWRITRIWVDRRKGQAGSVLHVRLVLLFSLVAVTPAILVAVFSALFLHFGVQAWFSERVRTAIEASNAVAHAYLYEHRQNIRAEAFAMANDLNRDAPTLTRNPSLFAQRLAAAAQLRSLSEALVVDGSGRVLARSPLSLTLELDLVPANAIEKANQGQIAVLTSEGDDRVRAVVRLNRFVDAYLLVGRFVETGVLEHIDRTEGAVTQYQRLEERRGNILITFVLIFVVVALLLLLAAVWIGLTLANQISQPISALISASERIRKGDLAVRVEGPASADEIGVLGRAFNRMTSQIETQQRGLIEANRELDERRRFTEAVLAGVSAGVIGLDAAGRVNLPNRSASDLLDTNIDERLGEPLSSVVPEMGSLLAQAEARVDRQAQGEIKLMRGGRARTLVARIVAEQLDGHVLGHVLTFDDVTALVTAERTAAWADVARRIAHEIKNPLTPIQLSAERLRRRYLKEVTSDQATFAACTETIIRQVEDIGRMVDEFSSFARMPRPDMKPEDLVRLVRDSVFMEQSRSPDIAFEQVFAEPAMRLRCDRRQVSRALTNLIKNAAESVAARTEADAAAGTDDADGGRIRISVEQTAGSGGGLGTQIVIEDNGLGFPSELRDRLTEPYVTTRARGTGLGLAIVRKIVEDHGGELFLEDRDERGARVRLVFQGSADEAGTDEHVVETADAAAPAAVAAERRANG